MPWKTSKEVPPDGTEPLSSAPLLVGFWARWPMTLCLVCFLDRRVDLLLGLTPALRGVATESNSNQDEYDHNYYLPPRVSTITIVVPHQLSLLATIDFTATHERSPA